MSDFYTRLDEKELEGRLQRLFADRPANLHAYQGCTPERFVPVDPAVIPDGDRTYISWADAGGPDSCAHGYAAGIRCPRCDEAALPSTEQSAMTFAAFQALNAERAFGAFEVCHAWTLNDWAVALAGEVGELCNLLKKNRRGLPSDEPYMLEGPLGDSALRNLVRELADVITYADIMMTLLGVDTGVEVAAKFDEVSRRRGWKPKPVADGTGSAG